MCVIHYIIVNISRTVHSQDFTSRKSLDTQRIRRLHTELCDAKITFFVVLILLSPITTISRYFRNFIIPFFWYQHVPLTVAQHFHARPFVLSWIHWRLSKSTKTKLPYTLYRWPLAPGKHQTVPPGNCGKPIYKSLPSYTQHSVTAASKLSSSSAPHFCVSASFNT